MFLNKPGRFHKDTSLHFILTDIHDRYTASVKYEYSTYLQSTAFSNALRSTLIYNGCLETTDSKTIFWRQDPLTIFSVISKQKRKGFKFPGPSQYLTSNHGQLRL